MNFRILFLLLSFATSLLLAPAAKADWYEASSDHFVIYADDSEKDIRRFAEDLERYHSALAYLTGRNVAMPSPSNRVTIFVAGSGREVRKLAGTRNSSIAGFYLPRAGGSKAFVQDIRNKRGYPHFSTVVLLHEYAHHFLISSSRYAMPRWMSEGAAEFFAATTFNKDGSLIVGRAAQHRGYELGTPGAPTARELLDPELYRRNRGKRSDGFYGRSWLLYHYLTFSKERAGQFSAYQQGLLDGQSSIEAAEAAFGDLDRLETELKVYLRGRFYTLPVSAENVPIGDVTLRKLPEGEGKMMPLRMISQRGVTRDQAEDLLPDVREVAGKYPNDPGVLAALAEAEYDAGNDAEAIAAADKAIAIDPSQKNAYVQKGLALFRIASGAADKDAAYQAAMKPFQALNARENDHPLPLIYYYRSFAERRIEPPENARAALERAAQLAPFDHRLWLQVAMMQAQEGKIELAKNSLQPLAANPHGGRSAEFADRLIGLLENIPEGTAFSVPKGPRQIRVLPASEGDTGSAEESDEGEEGSEPGEPPPAPAD
ncbi:DUF1570 domain-containing protein [Erythrobacter sp. THAF29]|uniref:DUF1570 domain-containing protein n=1 Tax=Erythrobacter sp. THAF29 TaxID=2587851 RepID=UPI0012A93257|nr:DUF1570 domain-containing protein [Erythrobacter sp. THAF29]QFT77139.1 hypothetical protein FIU90_06260 [Erythrobacter sp. THAF29]